VSEPRTFAATVVALGIATLAARGSGCTYSIAERSASVFHELMQRVPRHEPTRLGRSVVAHGRSKVRTT
jgi:hypothetical protein